MRCPICMELYINPKILSCGHTLCISCINNMIKANLNDYILCPICRSRILDINDNIPLNKLMSNLGLNINKSDLNSDSLVLENTLKYLISCHNILSKNIRYLNNMKSGKSNKFYGA